MTKAEYNQIMRERGEIISRNASIRLSNRIHGTATPLLPVPPKPDRPLGYEASEADGTYIGFYRTDNRAEVIEDLNAAGFSNYKLKLKPY